MAGRVGVTDCGLVADAEYGGEVEWVGSGGQGFVKLAIAAHLFDGFGQAGEVFLDPCVAAGVASAGGCVRWRTHLSRQQADEPDSGHD